MTATPGGPLSGVAAVPGDKSCSHRSLIFGAMATGETRIEGLLESDDVLATARAVAALGAEVGRDGSAWVVRGRPWGTPEGAIDCGNSGTAARLLLGAIAGREGVVATLTGDASLSSRPMRRVAAPLAAMGTRIEGGDRLPLTIHGAKLGGIDHVNVPASAQVKSAILLAGLGTDAPVRVIEPVPSRDHSEIMLGAFGVEVAVTEEEGARAVTLGAQRALTGTSVSVGRDPSSAGFPLVAAAIVPGSEVTVHGMLVNPSRTGLYEVLEAMGAQIVFSNERSQSGERVADVTVRGSALRPCNVAAEAVPAMIDEIPILGVAAAFADGTSVIDGLAELRVKESDRLAAVIAGLTACGVEARAEGDTLYVVGRGPGSVSGGGTVTTHGDHRIAMAFLTLGLAAQSPVTVDEPEMIATSFPGYADLMRALGAEIA
ncbi:3-phosphoshikimate 1-carboxyvinyltransferase [Sphingomonas sp. ASV193]|uniref:3-phosphoshikimate 1-carboxyvinyltransferase n=1 Tax=Sphingomonas sp. ASV193 TaxID=3144405 RepID=UPI0032E8C23A